MPHDIDRPKKELSTSDIALSMKLAAVWKMVAYLTVRCIRWGYIHSNSEAIANSAVYSVAEARELVGPG